jgi:hypothetical protein
MTKPRVQLSKTALLKPKIKSIDVDDGLVSIRALNASYAISLRGKTLGDTEIFDMLSKSICNEAGDPLLTPDEVGQLALSTLNQIVKGVMAFNSMAEGAVKEATDTLKNPPSDSIMTSPEL